MLEDLMLLKAKQKSWTVRKMMLFYYTIGCIGRAGVIIKSLVQSCSPWHSSRFGFFFPSLIESVTSETM